MTAPFRALPALIILCIAGCSSPRTATRTGPASSVAYHVTVTDSTRFMVSARMQGIADDTILFDFPMWGPGAYDIVNFGKYVENFRATDAQGRALRAERRDTNSFIIIGGGSLAAISYDVRPIRRIPNSLWFCLSDIGADYAFANTVALFGYPEGYKEIPYTVSYTAPPGWAVETPLDPAGGADRYMAADYDELVDAPMQMGKFRRLDFTVNGKPHTLTLTTFGVRDSIDIHAMADTVARVVEVVSDFFRDVPYSHYSFQVYLADIRSRMLNGASGALEHRNSSTYLSAHFPESSPVLGLMPVVAHEYWHLWSPKRIHVGALGPFDYQHPPHTASLWFAEGLTEYYAQALLGRSRMLDSRMVLAEFESAIVPLYHKPQRGSITELSSNISTLPLSDSYDLYSKGPLLGLLLDAEIRARSGGKKSLDDAMRYFNENYGKTGKTFADEEIIPIIETATGTRLGEFYDRYIAGRDELPIDGGLARLGMRMVRDTVRRLTFGAEIEQEEQGLRIIRVTPGGSADLMALRPGDLITKAILNGHDFGVTQFADRYDEILPKLGEEGMQFRITRDGTTNVIPGKFVEGAVEELHLRIDSTASAEARRMRQEMLGF